jgi:hypothetical protein
VPSLRTKRWSQRARLSILRPQIYLRDSVDFVLGYRVCRDRGCLSVPDSWKMKSRDVLDWVAQLVRPEYGGAVGIAALFALPVSLSAHEPNGKLRLMAPWEDSGTSDTEIANDYLSLHHFSQLTSRMCIRPN